MHDQPKYKPLAASDFFSDQRSARPVLEDTVARGHLKIDAARFTGKAGKEDVDVFPFAMTRADLEQGQARYNIYCTPCHSRIGDGNGMVVKRGYRQAASYHTDKLKKAPVGHFFDVITNGFGAMPSYASRVPVDDRWRIIAYIRALQLSQAAAIGDVPVAERAKLLANRDSDEPAAAPGESPDMSYTPPAPQSALMEVGANGNTPAPFSGVIPPAAAAPRTKP